MKKQTFAAILFASSAFLAQTPAHAQAGNARAIALAKTNLQARDGLEFLKFQATKIHDPSIGAAAKDILENPAPTFMTAWPDAAARGVARDALVAAGLLADTVTTAELFPPLVDPMKAPQPFLSTPAGTPDHHHGYPGGLAQHEAFNLQAALDLARNYRGRYGVDLDADLLIGGPIFHDSMKSWSFQWNRDGSTTPQATIAGTGAHHIFGIAEAMHRGLPPRFLVTLASAHDAPMGDTAPKVVGYLRAAAILAKVDPAALGVLVKAGETWTLAAAPPIEASINHLSDHDYVFTDPAAPVVAGALDRIARADAAPKAVALDENRLRWMRHRIQQKVSEVQLYQWFVLGGDSRIEIELQTRAIKLVDPRDVPPPL